MKKRNKKPQSTIPISLRARDILPTCRLLPAEIKKTAGNQACGHTVSVFPYGGIIRIRS